MCFNLMAQHLNLVEFMDKNWPEVKLGKLVMDRNLTGEEVHHATVAYDDLCLHVEAEGELH